MLILIIEPSAVLEMLYGHVFVSPSILSVLQKLSIVSRTHGELRLIKLDFPWENFYGKNGHNGLENGVFNFLKIPGIRSIHS